MDKLREERNRIWEQMKELLERTASTGMSAEESAQYDVMDGEVNRLAKDIRSREGAADLEKRLNEPAPEPSGLHRVDRDAALDADKAYRRAWQKHLRFGEINEQERRLLESRALSTDIGAAGGYLVPTLMADRIFEHMKWFGSVREVAGKITTTSGGDLELPNNDDTGNVGAILGQNTAVPEQDLTFGSRTFKAFTYTSKMVKVPWQLIQDSAFDIEAYLVKKLGQRLGRIQNTHFTTGTGAVMPEGFVTNATIISTATDDTLKLVDIVTLIYSVDRAYRQRGVFQMNDTIIAHLRKEQATTGEFVWQPSAQAGEPDRLFGYPVYANNDMASAVTDAQIVVAFGDFEDGYTIRDVKGMTIVPLKERFADSLQTGYFAYLRSDGQPSFASGSTTPPYKVLDVN